MKEQVTFNKVIQIGMSLFLIGFCHLAKFNIGWFILAIILFDAVVLLSVIDIVEKNKVILNIVAIGVAFYIPISILKQKLLTDYFVIGVTDVAILILLSAIFLIIEKYSSNAE